MNSHSAPSAANVNEVNAPSDQTTPMKESQQTQQRLVSTDDLSSLFPLPQPRSSRLLPPRISSVSERESAETARRLLKDNHERWHVMFNDLGYHNHASHHILAVYTLGAPKELIEAVYPHHTWYQRPLTPSPEAIMEQNFTAHLGDPKFYHSYANFFRMRILRGESVSSLLEKYIFSERMNLSVYGRPETDRDANSDANDVCTGVTLNSNPATTSVQQPHMLARLFASVFHPFIHVGNACEFGISGLLAEGLAETCVHPPDIESIITREFLGYAAADVDQSNTPRHIHLLTVLASINADPDFVFDFEGLDGLQKFDLVKEKASEKLKRYIGQWISVDAVREASKGCGTNKNGELSPNMDDLLEQMVWALTLMYGVSGWRGAERGFVADFFTMHNLTASLFLHSILPHLSRNSQLTLLRAFLLQALVWWISRGRSLIDIAAFYDGVGAEAPVGAYPSLGAGGAKGIEEVEDLPVELMPEQVISEEHAREARKKLTQAAEIGMPMYDEFATGGTGRVYAAEMGEGRGKVERALTPASDRSSDEEGGQDREDEHDMTSTPMTSASESDEPPKPQDVQDKLQVSSDFLSRSLNATNANPWRTIIRAAMVHPEEHVVKTVRALSHYAQLWGARRRRGAGNAWFFGDCKPGCEGSTHGTEENDDTPHVHLPGIEKLDETAFVRIAGMTMDRLGWMREGEKMGVWSGRTRSASSSAALMEQNRAKRV